MCVLICRSPTEARKRVGSLALELCTVAVVLCKGRNTLTPALCLQPLILHNDGVTDVRGNHSLSLVAKHCFQY